MKTIIKRSVGFLTICCTVWMALIGFGLESIPEEITTFQAHTVALAAPFTARIADTTQEETSPKQMQAVCKLLGVFPIKTAKVHVAKRQSVLLGGEVFGIKLYTKGVLVAKTDLVPTERGNQNPAQTAGIRGGDIITEIDGNAVCRKAEVSQAIEHSSGAALKLTVERSGVPLELQLTPEKSAADGKFVAGLWVRDSSAGIGTVTFYDKETGTVAGLGHAICDVDTGKVLPVAGGELVNARVMGCYRGVGGSPGELCGVFEPTRLASLEQNGDTGVYGTLETCPDGEMTPVALRSEVKAGPAQVLLTISGTEKRLYDVEIIRVSLSGNSSQKNMTIRVTDPALIEASGGIVQGMSGSPLLQDGQLVGAVTHVFVNSPLEGYAIFAETMLATAREVAAKK